MKNIFSKIGFALVQVGTNKNDYVSLRSLLGLVFQHRKLFIGALLGMVCYNFFNALPAWYAKDVVDHLSKGDIPDLDRFIFMGLAVVIVFSAKGFFFFIHNYLLGLIGQKTVYRLRQQLYDHLLEMNFGFFVKTRVGTLISHFTSDIITLQQALRVSLVGPFRDLPMIVILLGILGYRSWQLLLVFILAIPIAMVFIYVFGQANKLATGQKLDKLGKMSSLLSETMGGVRVVRAFGMQDYERKRFRVINNEITKKEMCTVKVNAYSTPIIEVIGCLVCSVVIIVGGHLIIQQAITPGDFVSFVLAIFMMNSPLKRLSGFNINIQEGLAACQNVFATLSNAECEQDHPNAKTLPPIKKGIQLKIKKFQHNNSKKIQLYNINIKIPRGKVIALVGPSGAGKTTIANMIPRFFEPQEGAITIDDIDVRKCSYDSLRNQIAMVNQEIFLFNDTVGNNIAYGKINCTQKSIITAAKAAYAHDFITALPQGYETSIGESGMQLSGGQRQRLCIARALVKDAPILILDEATSALDTESEQEIQLAISNLIKNRTTIVIAHRLSTIQQVDQIYVINNGTVMESGKYQELINQGGLLSRLHQTQFQNKKILPQSANNWGQWLMTKMFPASNPPEIHLKDG